ncbi:39S ribosomal protein L24 putative [Ochromonadaceae sp. CCMP2298]|nr:39S ribosomal protein L24 putative [Ochromonadaceae sp. CCMP2298]
MRWNIVRGDEVQVIEGPHVGQKGKIVAVLRDTCRVIIDGVNMRSRNIRPKSDGTPGRKIITPCSIHYSNVMLVDPTTGEPTKTSRRYLEDGSKVRVSKKTGNIIPKPDPLADRKPRSAVTGPKDTAPADVFKVTFADYAKYLPFIYASLGGKK